MIYTFCEQTVSGNQERYHLNNSVVFFVPYLCPHASDICYSVMSYLAQPLIYNLLAFAYFEAAYNNSPVSLFKCPLRNHAYVICFVVFFLFFFYLKREHILAWKINSFLCE